MQRRGLAPKTSGPEEAGAVITVEVHLGPVGPQAGDEVPRSTAQCGRQRLRYLRRDEADGGFGNPMITAPRPMSLAGPLCRVVPTNPPSQAQPSGGGATYSSSGAPTAGAPIIRMMSVEVPQWACSAPPSGWVFSSFPAGLVTRQGFLLAKVMP